ncbi:CsiV family protein [Methyloprofundus sp.]|uniref:CsiV family protein n=1 Tax=Methyloprofundus sp. TaxID=2020875 RepID=UPI003D0FE679
MSYRLQFQLAALLYCFTSLAMANQRWFQVELMVFQQQAPNTETFAQSQSLIRPVSRYAQASTGAKTLQGTYNRLKRAGAYQPFYYQSWKIPVASGSISLPIEVTEPAVDLTGWIKIQRGNLLHVIADLEFSPPESAGVIYRLNEKRRVLLNEVHYLDHPKFGVVVKVSPVEMESLQ